MARFSLFKRSNRSNYYVALKDPFTGVYLPAKSTGTADENDARLVVADWLKNGVPEKGTRRERDDLFSVAQIVRSIRSAELTTHDAERILAALEDRGLVTGGRIADDRPANEPLGPWLISFWSENSAYILEKKAARQNVTPRYIKDMRKWADRMWKEFFPSTALGEVTRQQLRDFQLWLDGKEFAPATIRKIMIAGTTPLRWAAREGIISTNPAEGLRQIQGESVERGILTSKETRSVFTAKWADRRAYVGNLVAATTGLRSGEILALRASDIGDDRLFVRHSWSVNDRVLKSPKNGEVRDAPLLPAVRKELLALLKENPYREAVDDPFVFWNIDPDRPCGGEVLLKGLRAVLIDMVLPKADRKDPEKRKEAEQMWIHERRVDIHSWRHQYATNLAANVDIKHLMDATGHKDRAVALAYASHESEERWKRVAQAVDETFSKVIPFEKGSRKAG